MATKNKIIGYVNKRIEDLENEHKKYEGKNNLDVADEQSANRCHARLCEVKDLQKFLQNSEAIL